MGVIGVGYYFILLELYGKFYSQKNEDDTVDIHQRVIANSWRKRVDKVHLVLTKMQLSDLLVYTKCDNKVRISIPNFSKYYGKYGDLLSKERKVKEKKRKESKDTLSSNDDAIRIEIINYLNQKTGTKFRHTSQKTKTVINARLNEKFNLQDFKKVIDIKHSEWCDDEMMSKFLRPETLFGTKFESYLNQSQPDETSWMTPEQKAEYESNKVN
jgi:uncharacterized phage protein (TIGR02220 family)